MEKIRATVSGFDFHSKCFCVRISSSSLTQRTISDEYDVKKFKNFHLIQFKTQTLSLSVSGMLFVFISKCKNFWTYIHAALCSMVFGVVFWFVLNPVNLCWFDVSSFWTTIDPLFVCVFVLFTSCHHRRLTFRIWVKCCVRAKYSEEIHPFMDSIVYWKVHNNRVYPI